MNTDTQIVPAKWDIEAPAGNFQMAQNVANACREIVIKCAVNIHGKNYVPVEGWQSIALTHGCVASARDVQRVYSGEELIGFKAIGEVRLFTNGQVIAEAEGFVGNDEKQWRGRDEYAKRAMCQTRAISRACRSAFAHIVLLMNAGLQTVPREEVPNGGFNDAEINEHESKRVEVARGNGKRQYNLNSPSENKDAHPQRWQDVVIHFGKNIGIRLGDLEENSLKWYCESWQPRPFRGQISEKDTALRCALDDSLGKPRETLPLTETETNETRPNVATPMPDEEELVEIPF